MRESPRTGPPTMPGDEEAAWQALACVRKALDDGILVEAEVAEMLGTGDRRESYPPHNWEIIYDPQVTLILGCVIVLVVALLTGN